MRALGSQFPWLSVPWYWTRNFCEQSEKSYKTMQRWRVCVSSPPKVWAVCLLSSSTSLLDVSAEREETQLFLFCISKADSLLTGALCTHSQAQKGT